LPRPWPPARLGQNGSGACTLPGVLTREEDHALRVAVGFAIDTYATEDDRAGGSTIPPWLIPATTTTYRTGFDASQRDDERPLHPR
jgi:hypothetical protein